MWNLLHCKWIVFFCSWNEVCYIVHYLEDPAQHVDSGIAARMECVIVNIVWKLLHCMFTVFLQLEWNVFQLTL